MLETLMQWALGLASSHPQVATLFMAMGILRAVFKPIMTLAQSYVEASPSIKDNAWLAKVQQDKVFKALVWLLDYTASVKVPRAK